MSLLNIKLYVWQQSQEQVLGNNRVLALWRESMHPQNHTPSICQNCRHYQPEGRRGGVCQMFQTFVESRWESCSLAELPFVYYLNTIEGEEEFSPTDDIPTSAVIADESLLSQT